VLVFRNKHRHLHVFEMMYSKMCYFAGEVENVLRELQPAKPVQDVFPDRYCQCVKYNCGCCVHFTIEEVQLINATGQCHYDAHRPLQIDVVS